jgi:alanyl-tRNA synthetase
MIAVRSWERAKGLVRIQFMAGARVLADYRKANATAREVAALFSAGREDSPALVAKLTEENKSLSRRVRELEQIACRVEAEELLRARSEHSLTLITRAFDNRSADSLKHLALALIAHPQVVALLGSRDGDTARLVFARSADASGDMNVLMRRACELVDGRGGGKAEMAQGGGKKVELLDEALATAAQSIPASS